MESRKILKLIGNQSNELQKGNLKLLYKYLTYPHPATCGVLIVILTDIYFVIKFYVTVFSDFKLLGKGVVMWKSYGAFSLAGLFLFFHQLGDYAEVWRSSLALALSLIFAGYAIVHALDILNKRILDKLDDMAKKKGSESEKEKG